MRIGVDFGTTRTMVAIADRGNFPLVSFPDENGDSREFIPSVAAADERSVHYGFDAAASGLPALYSMKRALAYPNVNAQTTVRIGEREFLLLDILTGFLFHVASAVRSATGAHNEILEAVVGVPAHAHSGQRFLTLEAFRRAGFTVLAMLNEPSAAGFEYTHRHASMLSSKRTKVLVYDLGGGTFDASLVEADGQRHEVLASRGNNLLGGDDFDRILAELGAAAAGTTKDELGSSWDELLLQARDAKEALHPQTRSIPLCVAGRDVVIPVFDYYDAVAPLVDETLRAMNPLLERADDGYELARDVAGLYVVGGGSELPVIARILREEFGRRVRRSPYSAGSTAIGLAIAASPDSGYSVTERLSRGFGVFRELHEGAEISFDPLLEPDQLLDGALHVSRRYRAAHNVGVYRFAEYSSLDHKGVPCADVVPLGTLPFPYDPELRRDGIVLDDVVVERTGTGHLIEESYDVDENGIITVTISDLDDGFEMSASLAR
ncbi:Hsp70 family protein [Arcanobacterium haemolyticum]|nr:Hsp70 family protein [Arcanobacterium haemolyticum]